MLDRPDHRSRDLPGAATYRIVLSRTQELMPGPEAGSNGAEQHGSLRAK